MDLLEDVMLAVQDLPGDEGPPRWRTARAIISLPTPVSPWIRTGASTRGDRGDSTDLIEDAEKLLAATNHVKFFCRRQQVVFRGPQFDHAMQVVEGAPEVGAVVERQGKRIVEMLVDQLAEFRFLKVGRIGQGDPGQMLVVLSKVSTCSRCPTVRLLGRKATPTQQRGSRRNINRARSLSENRVLIFFSTAYSDESDYLAPDIMVKFLILSDSLLVVSSPPSDSSGMHAVVLARYLASYRYNRTGT